MSNVVRICNKNWEHRVYRCAARLCDSMGDATMFTRANGITANPSMIIKYNPDILRKS